MRSKRVTAVLAGLLASFVGNAVVAAVLSVAISTIYLKSHSMQQYVALRDGPVFWSLSVIITLGAALTGGYVASRLSRVRDLGNSLATGTAFLFITAVLILVHPGATPWWVDLVYVLIVPAALAGGRLAWAGLTSAST